MVSDHSHIKQIGVDRSQDTPLGEIAVRHVGFLAGTGIHSIV